MEAMTANQLVAYNLRRARAGQTQELAAQRLERYLGKRWSVASFSDAERSAGRGRTREFDANELLAFAWAFEKPISYFFTPPDGVEQFYAGDPGDVSRPGSRRELLDATFTSGLALRDHVATLRDVADKLERADEAALKQAVSDTERKEDDNA